MNCTVRHTYELLLESRWTFKVNKKIKQTKKKYKQQNKKTIKQAHKPKQNKTKIYKRANEEYITQAQ